MWVDCKRGEQDGNAHCDMDDTPNATLSVFFEHGPYLCRAGQVTPVGINYRAVPFLVRRVFRKGVLRDLI